ncbi:MAG TPA: fatty acid desaturase CarF family protein [Planctomycetota bacterium]|nr:fatty acid desaturase CarF family protein [Planctomycetota bacterium]
MPKTTRPDWASWLDLLGICAFAVCFVAVLERLGNTAWNVNDCVWLLAALPLGYVLADFGTGFAHWFCDTFYDEDTFLIGPTLIYSFREHHTDQLAITRHGFLELNGANCLAVSPLLALLLFTDPAGGPAWLFLSALGCSFCAGMVLTNQFHRWAHDPSPHILARMLQNFRFVLTPEHHANHHAPPHRTHYCVTNGWMNGLLDRVAFWDCAERILVAVGVPKSRASESVPSVASVPDNAAGLTPN